MHLFTPIAMAAGAEGQGARSRSALLGLSARAPRQASATVRSIVAPASGVDNAKQPRKPAAFDLDLVVIGPGLLHRRVARDWRMPSGSVTPRLSASVR
jgi:hypothetical protein